MVENKSVDRQVFSRELEKDYYSRHWPEEAKPYLHLEPHLRCWLDPKVVFGGKRVLDIGAGECTYTRLIADKFAPKEIVACELFGERMLPAARASRSSNLKFIAGDAFCLPFRNSSFEVVFGSLVLCQLPNLAQIVREIQRVLVDDGCYIGIEPNPHHPVHLYRYLRGNHSSNQYLLGPKHLRAFDKSGFEVRIQYFWSKFPYLRNRLLGTTCMGIIAKRREEYPSSLLPHFREGEFTGSTGPKIGVHYSTMTSDSYFLSTISQIHLDRLVQIHMEAYPTALLTRLGKRVVSGYFSALLKDTDNFIGLTARPVGSEEIAAYCIGLLNGDQITRYAWGTNRCLTAIRVFSRVLPSPYLWKTVLLQLIGWLLHALRNIAGDRPYQNSEESGAAALVDIACAVEHRRRGLGRWILEGWEREMVRRGASGVKLFVKASSTAAIRLYEDSGWKIIRPMRNIQQPGYVMKKNLRSSN